MTEDVGTLASRGALWGVISQVTQQGLSIVATVVLARVLTPADFGFVAAAITVLQLVQLALTFGWQPAIVRRPLVDEAYLSSVFWLLSGLGTTLTIAVALGSPILAALIGISGVQPYIAVLGLQLIPAAALIVPQALLQRRLDLRAMNVVGMVAVVVYVVVQLVLAVLGAGAWAVIIGMVVLTHVQLLGMCIAARWRPRLYLRIRHIRKDFGLVGGLLLNSSLTYGVRNIDYWIVGRTLGAAMLGAYYVAYTLPQILRLRMTWVAGSVVLPILVRTRSDLDRTNQVYAKILLLMAWIGFPAMVGLSVLAEPVMRVFFGPQWDAAVPPLRWLAMGALVDVLAFGPQFMALAVGEVRRLFVTNVVRVIVLTVAVGIAAIAFQTLEAIAAGVFVATLIWAFHQHFAVGRPLGLAFGPLRKDLLAMGTLSGLMGIAVGFLLEGIGGWPSVVQLLTCTVAGGILYLGLGWLLFRNLTVSLTRSVLVLAHRRAHKPGE